MRISDWSSDVCSSDLRGAWKWRPLRAVLREHNRSAVKAVDTLLTRLERARRPGRRGCADGAAQPICRADAAGSAADVPGGPAAALYVPRHERPVVSPGRVERGSSDAGEHRHRERRVSEVRRTRAVPGRPCGGSVGAPAPPRRERGAPEAEGPERKREVSDKSATARVKTGG